MVECGALGTPPLWQLTQDSLKIFAEALSEAPANKSAFFNSSLGELLANKLLLIIKKSKILKRDSIILIHRDKKFIDEFPESFKVIITKNYGRSKILFGKFLLLN